MTNVLTTNKNFLSQLGFVFKIQRLPNVEYFCQSGNIPGITLGVSTFKTPFKDIPVPGDHLEYEDLTITFKVDEDLQSWLEIYNWMTGLGFPESFDQFNELKAQNPRVGRAPSKNNVVMSDATMTVLSSNMNPKFRINFHDLFPIALSGINFSSTDDDVAHITASATFKYLIFKVERIGS